MKILDFALKIGKLKKIKRAGWIRENIPDSESVADHSFRTAILAMIIAPKTGIDANKAIKMALIHDIAEAEIGDIVTKRGKKVLDNLKNKIAAEKNALTDMFSLIGGNEYIQLFSEFEENKTPEAQFVKQIEKLEMTIQALEYEKEHNIKLQEFFDDANSAITNKKLQKIIKQILKLRTI